MLAKEEKAVKGSTIWIVGNSSERKANLIEALGERLRSDGTDVQVLNKDGGFGSFTALSEARDDEWGGYAIDAIHIGKLLTRYGSSVIVPLTSVSRNAYQLAKLELENFLSVYIPDGNRPLPKDAKVLAGASGNGGASTVGISWLDDASAQTETGAYDFTLTNSMEQVSDSVEFIMNLISSGNGTDIDSQLGGPVEELEVSILMPCLNEAEAIADCVTEAKQTLIRENISGEVVVIDNGSTDGSPEIAIAAGARVVRENRRGYGSAYLRGISEARGKYLIMGDSDGTYDFTMIPEFLKLLKEGHEFVNGSRIKGDMDDGAIPFLHRYIGVPVLTWILNRLSGANFSDAHCGMRGFTKEAALKMGLTSPGMEFASEMILQSSRAELKTTEMPIRYRTRKGESKLRTFSDGWRHIRFMLLQSPTHLFIAPGVFLLVIGMAMMLALVGGKLEVAGLSFDIHYMVVGSILAVLGFQIASLGLSARIYALSIGLFRRDALITKGMNILSLEKGILLGSLTAGAGLAILASILIRWLMWGFDSGGMLRPSLLAMTLVVIGVQAVFSSFFLSLLSMKLSRDSISNN